MAGDTGHERNQQEGRAAHRPEVVQGNDGQGEPVARQVRRHERGGKGRDGGERGNAVDVGPL